MSNSPSTVAPFFRSDAQGRILAQILLTEGEQATSEVSAATRTPLQTVCREVARLAAARVVTTRKVGKTRLVATDPAYPLLAPLSQIVAATYGPAVAVRRAFAGLDGVERLLLIGPWAQRMSAGPGPLPDSVDVLVVGPVATAAAAERGSLAGARVGREVRVRVVSRERWEGAEDTRPVVELACSAAGTR